MNKGRFVLSALIASASMMLVPATSHAEKVVTLIAGNGSDTPVLSSGPAKDMSILPTGIDTLPDGTILIAEAARNRVLALKDGQITTVLGTGAAGPFTASGTATEVPVNQPQDVAAAPDGGFWVTEQGSDAIKKVKDGNVTTVATSVSNVSRITTDPDGGFYVLTATDPPNPATSIEHFDEDYARTLAVPGSFTYPQIPQDLVALPGGEIRYTAVDGVRSANESGLGSLLESGTAPGPMDRFPDGDFFYSDTSNWDSVKRTNLSDPFTRILGSNNPLQYLEEGCTDGAPFDHARVRGVALAAESNDSFVIADSKHLYRVAEGTPTLAPKVSISSLSETSAGYDTWISLEKIAICGYPVTYQWDMDSNPDFELDQGTNGQTFLNQFSGSGDQVYRLKATNPVLGTSAIVTHPIHVLKASRPGLPGISINNGAQFTNDPNVTVSLRWGYGIARYFLSNDGGFVNPGVGPIDDTASWTLDSSGPERLPKTVYVRFAGTTGDPRSEQYSDDIILDQTPPDVPAPNVEVDGLAVNVETDPDDEVSGVEDITWDFGDGVPTSRSSRTSLKKATVTKTASHTYSAPGTYQGKVTATDYAGNETTRTFKVKVARTPPYAKLTVTVTGKKANNRKRTAFIRFRSNGEGVTFRCGLKKKPTAKCRSPYLVKNLKPGKTTKIFIRAADKYGLTATTSTTVKVK